MRTRLVYKKTTVKAAILVVVISTVTLSYLSYTYSVGTPGVLQATIAQSNIKLVEQTVERIEQKVIENDRILAELIDVDNPVLWGQISDAVTRREDLNVDLVWFIRPNGTRLGEVLYPSHDSPARKLSAAFRSNMNLHELDLGRIPLNSVYHIHKERGLDSYFFASYLIKEDRNRQRILIVFQMNFDRCIGLIDSYLQSLRPNYYIRLVDYENNGVYEGPLPESEYFYETRFNSTFYKWLLQIVPRNYSEIDREVKTRRRINLFFILLSMSLIFSSLVVIYLVGRRERQLAQLKEDFISNVSHELRTPLSLIRMFSEILVLGRVRTEESKQEYYGIIYRESDRMSRLIANLLDFARLGRGVPQEQFERTNIGDLVRTGLEAYQHQLRKDGFRIILQVDDTVPETYADANGISLAFFNLLDNSIKYSVERKELTIRVSQSNGCVRLSVTDHGMGIPEKEREKIFEKFYRGENAIRRKIRGSGIGLSLIRQVAERHGGEVLVDSAPGKGSTFTLQIPVREPPPDDSRAAAPGSDRGRETPAEAAACSKS